MTSTTFRGRDPVVYDMHCHLHEYSLRELEEILEASRGLRIVAVSDDLESTLKTLEIEAVYPDRVIACVGLHPWSIGEEPLHKLETLVEVAERGGVRCIGEVGLDARFVPQHTWGIQVRVFRRFLELARELGALVNIHAPDAWSEVLGELIEYDVEKALFHWYTGPLNLVDVIGERGYKVSINPALKIQEKHARIAAYTPVEYMVFESDAPYDYKGLKLNPLMVRESMEIVSKLKRIDIEILIDKARWNSERLLTR